MSGYTGYDLWLHYNTYGKSQEDYTGYLTIALHHSGGVWDSIRHECILAIRGLTGTEPVFVSPGNIGNIGDRGTQNPGIVFELLEGTGHSEEYRIVVEKTSENREEVIRIQGFSERGLLYGTFVFFRLVGTNDLPEPGTPLLSKPALDFRMLNHWDNLDGTIERGYAGKSLWKWEELPGVLDSRYRDYARACASIGINATVLNNVNDAQKILTPAYREKVVPLAGLFVSYGITTFLSVNFASPMIIGGLPTADPLDKGVIQWWKELCRDMFENIPGFGGFLVKADSEGQPGPFQYGRTQNQGANCIARALQPWGGILIWRAFVYGHGEVDRAMTAYDTFTPLDGSFDENVVVQIKNGAIDFQPREPVHPLFYSLEKTNVFMEFQITQEYLGQGNHLVYLGPMWKEILDFSFQPQTEGYQVQDILKKKNPGKTITGIAAVSNIGNDQTWCGSHFHPLNWYAYGRLTWDPTLDTQRICDEWIQCTFSRSPKIRNGIAKLMNHSWEHCIDYMTPLGLHHIMKEGHHYGPDPGFQDAPREDWRSTYYHRADSFGVGFDRTRTGSKGVDQYPEPLASLFHNVDTCPEKYLLWFHHVGWKYRTSSGRTLIDEIAFRYNQGVRGAGEMLSLWESLEADVDSHRFSEVREKLLIQLQDAKEWEAVCVEYFRSFVVDV